MSNTILRNENVSVTLKSLGGELTSIKDASGTEYLWQGNPDFWSGQAPVLFPIVGCLRNGTATIGDSKTCSFGRHGLARKLEFTLVSSSETCAVYSLKADDSTKEQYPYDFELQMIYELTDHGVKVSHKVINHGDIVMPYCIGGHPAFNCPVYEGENFEDYIVEFEQNGEDRTAYGEQLLKKLEKQLNTKGLNERRFREFRRLYLVYPQLKEEVLGYVMSGSGIRRGSAPPI